MKSRKMKGAALIWVICISLVLMILGSALLDITVANAKQAANSANKNQANFLARSGVNTGLKMLQQKLYDSNNNGIAVTYTDRATLISALNTMAKNGTDIVVDGAGSFNIRFQDLADGTDNIKIIGVGKSKGSNPTEDTVTLTVKLSMPDSSNISTNPDNWFSSNGNSLQGINSQKVLSHNVTTDMHHLGKMVILNGGIKSVKYPQGGNDAESIFRASVIAFKSYRDGTACLSQDSNNLDVTFDAEIIFFGDNVESKGKDVRITASPDVLNRPDTGILQPAEPKGVGFNDKQRYINFVQSFNNSLTPETLEGYWGGYDFKPGYQYGIVCFKKNISGINSSYYFFPGNGTDGLSIIHHEDRGSILGFDRLIKINDDDPIIDALDIMFNNSGNCSVLYWDNK